MNKTPLTILAMLVLLLSGCEDRKSRAKEETANPSFMFWCFRKEIVSSEYHVPEMATPEAADYLQQVMRTVPGFEGGKYDLSTRTMTISYRSSIVRKMNFEEAIALSGFSVNGRPANPAAEQKLPEGIKQK